MKRYLFFFLTILLASIVQAGEIDNGYRIVDWDYQAQVHEDNSWTVTEKLTVEYLEQRHGIYRYIPRLFVRHRNDQGDTAKFTYITYIYDIEVEGYEMTLDDANDEQENLIIRIGSEYETVTGQHTYVIRYKLLYPDDRYPSSDELFHTVLGPDCNTTIGRFSYQITFDKPLPPNLNIQVFSGEWASKSNKINITPNVRQNRISGTLTNIEPYNGITLQAELPEGFWQDTLKANRSLFDTFLIAFIILSAIVTWRYLSNKRKRPTMIIEYNAPEGISSAEVGVIIDDAADLSDLTSLIVWFASKGFLKIREFKKEDGYLKNDIELTKLKDLPFGAPAYQVIFFNIFFRNGKTILLSELGDEHKKISEALLALKNKFRGKYKLTKCHYSTLLAFIGAILAGGAAIGNSGSVCFYPDYDMIYAIPFWACPIFTIAFIRAGFSNYDMIKGKTWHFWINAIIIVASVISYGLFKTNHNPYDSLISEAILSAIIITGWVLTFFSNRIFSDTEYRKQQMALLLGFREFIQKSELPMLQALVDENPSYFYDVLPYAMVFGLSDKWQEQFRNIQMETPDWYETSNISNITPFMAADRLTNHITDSIHRSIEISSHDPDAGSSGGSYSSGGGFSGGGGGGGGVGSW